MPERDYGCVTNFDHQGQKLALWKAGNHFTLSEFGIGGRLLSITSEPLFQSIAAEIHRLACEVGSLRRREIEQSRKTFEDPL